MSSPVHTARCVRRAGRVVDIEIGPTTATGVHFPISPTFALGLLLEATELVRPKPPLASVISFEEMIELSNMGPNEHKDAIVATFVASARYVAARNWTPAFWSGLDARDPRAIAVGTELDEMWEAIGERDDFAYDAKHAPHATLRIEVTEERWCEHLRASLAWDVYAFDDDALLLV